MRRTGVHSCNLPVSITRSTQAARCFLWSVRMLMLLFQAFISTLTNTYIISSYNLLVVVYVLQYNTCHNSIDIMRYIACVKASVRWVTGKRLTNRLPKLSLITLPPSEQRDSCSSYVAVRAYSEVLYNLWQPKESDLSDSSYEEIHFSL